MTKSSAYMPRTYRYWLKDRDLVSFQVVLKETDLLIRAKADLSRKAEKLAIKYREQLEKYISTHPDFLISLTPVDVEESAPIIVKEMANAAVKVGVGPMAAVAGAIAEFVGKELLAYSPEIIVENGGDIYLKSSVKRTVGIYAGDSPLSGKIGLVIRPELTPLGVCTSSGTVGHSLSFGKADAAVAVASSATLADAAATALGNLVKSPDDIDKAIRFARDCGDLMGIILIIGGKMGVWGNLELVELERDNLL